MIFSSREPVIVPAKASSWESTKPTSRMAPLPGDRRGRGGGKRAVTTVASLGAAAALTSSPGATCGDAPDAERLPGEDPVRVGDVGVQRPDLGPAPGVVKVGVADPPERVPLLHDVAIGRQRGRLPRLCLGSLLAGSGALVLFAQARPARAAARRPCPPGGVRRGRVGPAPAPAAARTARTPCARGARPLRRSARASSRAHFRRDGRGARRLVGLRQPRRRQP